MGRGDKKSKKGKIRLGSYGVSRKKNAIKARLKRIASKPAAAAVASVAVAEAKPKAKRVSRKKESAAE